MTGNKKRELGRKATQSSMSIVEKLKILRSLECGFSERDLSNCLRQTGYRVDIAAEWLVTGRYRPLKKSKNNIQVDQTVILSTSTQNSNHANATSRQDMVQQRHYSSLTPPSKYRIESRHSTVDTRSKDQLTASELRKRKHTSEALLSSSSSVLVTPKTTTSIAKNVGKGKIANDAWLLCHRWVSDGMNLQRGGTCDYDEEFHVLIDSPTPPRASSSFNSPKALRFRSERRRIDGSFPRYLSFLGPLLRNQLIRVKATALMEEHRLSIGSQVAFSLSVWIVDLIRFFAVFDDTPSYSKQFFATVAVEAHSNRNSQQGSANMINELKSGFALDSYRDAAFSLLQWAHYGKLHSSHPPEICVDDSNNYNRKNIDEATVLNDSTNDGCQTNSTFPAIDTPPNDVDANIPNWAGEVICSNDSEKNNSDDFVRNGDGRENCDENEKEMDTPLGFRKGIKLRHYQKQSLHWMTRREKKHGSGRNELVQILKGLANESLEKGALGKTESRNLHVVGSRKEIFCDCGPVLVDTNLIDAPSVAKVVTLGSIHDSGLDTNEHRPGHPLWERRFLCNELRTKALSFYVQPSFQNAAAEPPPPPLPCRGGILADSMGLGKTVQLLALVQSDEQYENNRENKAYMKRGKNCNRSSTLIVAPLSLLHQWQNEIENKTSLSYKVHYNDGNKGTSVFSSIDFNNIVLTTYGTLQAEFRSHRYASSKLSEKITRMLPLLSKTWKRVILDECHTIKNHSTAVAKACCLLKAERRWCVSGTIVQNSLEDLYSLLRFLRHEPFCEKAFWRTTITNAPNFSIALNRVKNILSPIMIRRTKETRNKSGELILPLPDIDSKTVFVQFSFEEKQFYDAIYQKSYDIFKDFVRVGTASSSWLRIFSLLHRLRQACSHVALTLKSHLDDGEWSSYLTQLSLRDSKPAALEVIEEKYDDSINQSFLQDLLEKFEYMQNCKPKTISPKDGNYGDDDAKNEYPLSVANMLNQACESNSLELNEECPICLENISMADSVITPCLHIFCKNCLTELWKNDTRSPGVANLSVSSGVNDRLCPICSKNIDSQRILRIAHSMNGKIETRFLHHRMNGKVKENQNISVADVGARNTLQKAMKGRNSSKLTAILSELRLLWEKEPGSKVLVFSQFLGFLDIIEKSLQNNNIPYGRLDGNLSLKRRNKVLHDFGSRPQRFDSCSNSITGSVLLISMKAGGVGLNLIAARSVFIVDPWWNGAVEDQCVDRIHRIGQLAQKIYVRKFVVANSIEERIVELQRRKKGIARAALCDKSVTELIGLGTRPCIEDFKTLFRA